MNNNEEELQYLNQKNPIINKLSSLEIYSEDNKLTNVDTLEKLTQIYFQPMHPGSLRASIFCLICVTLGSGMLPLPYFLKANGIILTLILFFLCAFSTLYTLKILINLSYKNQIYSYNELVGKYYGYKSKMEIYSIIVLLINSLGSIIAWNALINKFIKDILLYFSFCNDKNELYTFYFALLILCLIQIPLATFKTVAKFYIISTIGIIQILYVILVVMIEFPVNFKKNFNFNSFIRNKNNFINVNWKLVEMPLVFFIAFGNHSTILSVVNEIQNKSKMRVRNAGRLTFYSEMTIYLIVMIFSFFSTLDKTNEVFLDRAHLSTLMFVGEFLMLILMICNISLYYYMMLPLLELFFNNKQKFDLPINFLMAFTTLTILTFISFYVEKIIHIFSFIGASAQVSLIFVLPLSLYMKNNEMKLSGLKKTGIIGLICLFCFIGMMFFVLLIVDFYVKVM